MNPRFYNLILLFVLVFYPFSAQARYFDPNDILTDAELLDSSSLSRTAIQQFLEAKNSVLKNVSAAVEGVPKLVSEMIYELGKKYGISQKFLLAKLQHEQGLIEKSTASQNAIDWATGYSCFNNRCNDKYKGMYNQLEAAAEVQKIYSQRGQSDGYFRYQVGKETKTSDNYQVKPINQATANLYIYTPYRGGASGIGGNYAFWRVWNRYFTERDFPDGALLKDSATGLYWKIEENKRRQFSSADIYLQDYKDEDAVAISADKLGLYQIGQPITYPNNTVVRAKSGGIIYLLSDNLKYRLVGSQALASLGYHLAGTSPIEPVIVEDNLLENYEEGEPITEESIYPQGILATNSAREMFLLKNGFRFPLLDEAIWQENFNRQEPIAFSDAQLAGYPLGAPLILNDGSIVKSADDKYYIISNNTKQKVVSGDIIKRVYGLAFYNQVPIASAALLDLHATGDAIDYIDDSIPDPAIYVSYAEKVGAGQSNAPTTQQPNYLALYDTFSVSQSLLVGQGASVTVKFRNRGASEWLAGKVYLKLIDENKSISSFIAENRIALQKNIQNSQLAEFTFNITAPLSPGKIKEWFILEYENADGKMVEMPGALVGRDINVISGVSAQIIKENIPAAVRSKWKPISVTIKLKNTSTAEIWTGRRAAFMIADEIGGNSVFYDKTDWIDKQTAGVPLNKSKIKPGEEGIVKFTLNPRGVKPGIYHLVFSMELRDAKEKVYLNGSETWEKLIRVDP